MTRARSSRPPRGLSDDPLWYKDAIIYEVRTGSFFDSNGDGVGDLLGLKSKLDYLADLGVTAIWILPHYPSPGRDDGYDCADYTGVHSDIGSIEDFDAFVEEAHKRGLRVITELVINHTSDQHPWFQRSRRAPPGSVERDFYVWSDTSDRYRDARIIFRDFEPSNWSWDPVAGAYYWHRFFSHQPDLNFENPAVHEAVLGVVDFWLARGVDGLRLDAVPYLYEAEGTNCENLPATHEFLKKLRAHVDAKFPNRMLLAEANQWPEDAAAYFGDGDECHMNFHFPIMPRLFMSIQMEDRFPIVDILKQTPELHPSCQWAMFLRNHDELTLEMVTDEERDYMYRVYAHEAQMRINLGIRRRLAPLVGNDRKKMELLNGLLFSMPGTPVIYYGDEIGMGDNVWLGDRNGVRTPMQWSADRNAGFSRANPQRLILPVNIDPEYHFEALNVEQQQSNPNSLLWWTKRLIAMRKRYRAFGRGTLELLHPTNPRVLAFVRCFEEETILVVANLSRRVQFVELDLGAMKGAIPVELTGRTRFPAVGELPYMLTLGGHDLYWFSLEAPRDAAEDHARGLATEVVLSCSSADALLLGDERSLLEEVLPGFLLARGLVHTQVTSARITEAARIPNGATPLTYVFVRVEYVDGEPESFALPVVVVDEPPPGAMIVAHLAFHDASGKAAGSAALIEATTEGTARALVETAVRGTTMTTAAGRLVGGVVEPDVLSARVLGGTRVVDMDRTGASIAFGDAALLKLLYRMEEGTAPELELARHFGERLAGLTPRILGYVERRVGKSDPSTLALLQELIENEGTGWQHARGEVDRMYERMTAYPSSAAVPPRLPASSLVELSSLEPPPEHLEAIGPYRDWALLLGRRIADLHRVLASSTAPAFEPVPYSTMDQRSKYQSGRNLIGRVLASLRRTLHELPPRARGPAGLLVKLEDRLLARFEPVLTRRVEARRIRCHGDMRLERVLFTGKDFVIVGVGGGRDRRIEERRRKRGALVDVASMMRSFHYAAATAIATLRPEDQARAEPWGWVWQRWASAALLRGYLEGAQGAAFVPSGPLVEILLEASLLEKAFGELQVHLQRRQEQVWIPLEGILHLVGVEPPR